jgi:DNA-directed RNA polymerase subunit omega
MSKRFRFDSTEMIYLTDKLMSAASSRYTIVVQVAKRAKRCRYETVENIDDPMIKPVQRALMEMTDELTEPELLRD